ncbi:hypothetical protein GCM10012278_89340 [Nonomuraea glycinis]|uniref:Uncharacterized protein n=1 Tax=Nonomuraea glycinis TaxID=2047744 RepID=A0A918AFR8_9ACTN|nr:hypothetical protein GCM10012278_89340 [Nonomuraea glycinis]
MFTDTSAARATSATVTLSNPRDMNNPIAMSEMRSRVSRFFRSRSPSSTPPCYQVCSRSKIRFTLTLEAIK